MSQQFPGVRELLHIQLRTLFVLDRLGNIARFNEPTGMTAPRIFVARGEGERLVRVHSDVPELAARAWLAATSDAHTIELVSAHAAITRQHRGPATALPALRSSDETVEVFAGHRLHPELLARGWRMDETAPYVGVVRDGFVVAVCYSARWGIEAAEAGVETASEYRGRGLALEAVRGWAAAVQSSGRLALYSTDWDNAASRRVAAKLSAFEYGEDWHLT